MISRASHSWSDVVAEDADDSGVTDRPSGLTRLERAAAGLLGLGGVGCGGFGVFYSSNQAGTTALLLIGAAFLLMAVQGTAIVKAGKDSFELERRRAVDKLTEKATDALEDEQTAEAAVLLDAAREMAPQASDAVLRRLTYELYEQRVAQAVAELPRSLDISRRARFGKHEFDLVVTDPARDGRRVAIEVRTTSGAFLGTARVRAPLGHAQELGLPVLIVANARLSTAARAYFGPTAAFVEWQGDHDSAALHDAIGRLLDITPSTE